MSEIAPPRSTDAASEPVGFGPAVVSSLVAQAVGGGLVSVIGAFVLPLVLRMFRYRISFGAALIALFAGVVAANVLFGVLTANGARSPYFAVPVASTYGAVGSILSLLLTAWIVQQSSRRS